VNGLDKAPADPAAWGEGGVREQLSVVAPNIQNTIIFASSFQLEFIFHTECSILELCHGTWGDIFSNHTGH